MFITDHLQMNKNKILASIYLDLFPGQTSVISRILDYILIRLQ